MNSIYLKTFKGFSYNSYDKAGIQCLLLLLLKLVGMVTFQVVVCIHACLSISILSCNLLTNSLIVANKIT